VTWCKISGTCFLRKVTRPRSQTNTSLPHSVPRKMIDFGIFFDPGAMSDPEAVNAINRVCTNLPELAINHTPLEALMEKPLWLCVETKKPGKGFETGKLQIGAWLAAHWNFLESLIAAQSPDDDAHAASEAFQALEFFCPPS